MREKTVIFYAPLGKNTSPDKIGGAEAGCLKTLEILRKNGFHTIVLHKPVKNKGILNYICELTSTWVALVRLLLANKGAVLHVAGFYLKLVGYEWLFIRTANVLGHRCVYEIRNGGMVEEYKQRGKIYKYLMLSILRNATDILCQGTTYITFIKEQTGRDSCYYPNYIMDEYISENYTDRGDMCIKFVFFGRIAPSKNIGLMLDIVSELRKQGLECKLYLIGGYSTEYHAELKNKISELCIPDGIVCLEGRQDFESISRRLKDCHFFLFPSEEKREGHSNSLTEAMGCGVVPLVSDAGFNRSIVGDDSLVVPYSASSYVVRIREIWESGMWNKYSQQVYERIVGNFTESIVSKSLLDVYYKKLFIDTKWNISKY